LVGGSTLQQVVAGSEYGVGYGNDRSFRPSGSGNDLRTCRRHGPSVPYRWLGVEARSRGQDSAGYFV